MDKMRVSEVSGRVEITVHGLKIHFGCLLPLRLHSVEPVTGIPGMNSNVKTTKDWAVRLVSAVIALHVAVGSCIGAAYAFAPAVLGGADECRLPFVVLAVVATFSGISVMGQWVNGSMLWAFSKILKN